MTLNSRRVTSSVVPYDRWLILISVILVGLGLLMVASASIVVSDESLHQPFYFFYRQLAYLILGVFLGILVVQFEMDTWEKSSGMVLLLALLLLALVLIPGLGRSVNGSVRWIGLGFFSVQVSEFAKFAVVIFMAGYLFRRNDEIKLHFSGFLKPMAILGVVAILLLKEPDFGATVVVVVTALGMMFLAGMRLRELVVLVAIAVVGLSILAISEPYRVARLTTFLNPWANPYGSGYQLIQSLIAFGRGGIFGTGLGNSIQKLFYLPEAHTDFLFAVIAEEFGLLGMLVIVALFTLLVLRIFMIGRTSQQLGKHFAGYVCYGFGLWIFIQFAVNVGVSSGMLPTKGLTLPLMSYGGSSMLMTCVVIALLLRIDYENRTAGLKVKDE